MRKIARYLTMLVLMLLLCSASVLAADDKPGKVNGIKATSVGETGFTLKWSKVSKATGYYVYRVDETRVRMLANTKATSYKVTQMTPGKSYRFMVVAYRKVKNKIYMSDTPSNIITVSSKIKKPSKPTGFRVGVNGSRTLELNWNKASNATGYQVFRYDSAARKYTLAKTVSGTSCKFTGLTAGKKYTFAVRSYRKVSGQYAYSTYTPLVSEEAIQLSAKAAAVRSFRYIRKTKKRVTVYNYDKKKNQTLSAGTKVYVSSKTTSGYLYGYLTNGQKVKIKASALGGASGIEFNAKSDYSTAVKEEFINSKNLTSPTKYLIWINQYRARVNVFKGSVGNWKLVRSFKVVLGRTGSVRGIRKIYGRSRWGYENLPVVYWSPNGNAFHSLLGARVGTAVSGGCIRCASSDLWYLYNTIPNNTTVYSY